MTLGVRRHAHDEGLGIGADLARDRARARSRRPPWPGRRRRSAGPPGSPGASRRSRRPCPCASGTRCRRSRRPSHRRRSRVSRASSADGSAASSANRRQAVERDHGRSRVDVPHRRPPGRGTPRRSPPPAGPMRHSSTAARHPPARSSRRLSPRRSCRLFVPCPLFVVRCGPGPEFLQWSREPPSGRRTAGPGMGSRLAGSELPRGRRADRPSTTEDEGQRTDDHRE